MIFFASSQFYFWNLAQENCQKTSKHAQKSGYKWTKSWIFLLAHTKSQNFAHGQLNFAPAHNGETVPGALYYTITWRSFCFLFSSQLVNPIDPISLPILLDLRRHKLVAGLRVTSPFWSFCQVYFIKIVQLH